MNRKTGGKMMTHSQNPNQFHASTMAVQPPARLISVSSRHRSHSPSRGVKRMALMITFWLFTALFTSAAHAAKSPIYTSFLNNKAVGGYDAVSYFQGDMMPIKGKKQFTTTYKDADWFFASKENLDTFSANPEKYEPQYGGYCAYAVALGDTVKGDPLQYHISDGKLYLNINAKYKKIWLGDKIGYIEKAEKQWPDLLN